MRLRGFAPSLMVSIGGLRMCARSVSRTADTDSTTAPSPPSAPATSASPLPSPAASPPILPTQQPAQQPAQQRHSNRIVMVCASINDQTAWPFWKLLQMKRMRGITDLAMLSFMSGPAGSFEARIVNGKCTVHNLEWLRHYRADVLSSFLDRWHDPGRTYFVYGGHGMGDYLELEKNRFALQVHELAEIMGTKRYEAAVFDACFMSNLDACYHLRNNTPLIGACEGYMWEEDIDLDHHVINGFTASAMSRYTSPLNVLETIKADFVKKSALGDFAILRTEHAGALYEFAEDHVLPHMYTSGAFVVDPEGCPLSQQQQQQQQQQCLAGTAETDAAEAAVPTHQEGSDAPASPGAGNAPEGAAAVLTPPVRSAHGGASSVPRKMLTRAAKETAALEDAAAADLFAKLKDTNGKQRQDSGVATTPPAAAECQGTRPGEAGSDAVCGSAVTLDKRDHELLPMPYVQMAHSLVPNEREDRHLLDLLACIRDLPCPALVAEGEALFHQVVHSHAVGESVRERGVYSAALNGLSITAHELSEMSMPRKQTSFLSKPTTLLPSMPFVPVAPAATAPSSAPEQPAPPPEASSERRRRLHVAVVHAATAEATSKDDDAAVAEAAFS